MPITYTPLGHTGFRCRLSVGMSRELSLTGTLADGDEMLLDVPEGDPELIANASVLSNLAAHASHELLARRTRSDEKRANHSSEAKRYARAAAAIAEMVLDLGDMTRTAWCSCCFLESQHRRVRARGRRTSAYLCDTCGAPTIPCAVPTCNEMASRGIRNLDRPRYCAPHRHEIPSFNKMAERLVKLDNYADWLKFEHRNAGRITKIAGVAAMTAACIGPQALAAAPAIGGAIGANAAVLGLAAGNLSGAAATNFGLAWLGGGSLAAGGLGMAGGTTVVTAVGTALGGTLGAVATTAYVRADSSFRLERLREGTGPAVLIASGFLTEGTDGWGKWQRLVDARYPDSPVYRVHWGAKELKAFGVLAGVGGGKVAAKQVVGRFAGRASKKVVGLGPLSGLLVAIDVASNPWSVAKNRAGMTGAVLADLIARCDDAPFILVGHSLGARVMVTAAQALASKPGRPRIAEMHLLGGAVGASGNWRTLHEAVAGTVWNYHSRCDGVLKLVYQTVQAGQKPIGRVGIRSKYANIRNVDVTSRVDGHGGYFNNVSLKA